MEISSILEQSVHSSSLYTSTVLPLMKSASREKNQAITTMVKGILAVQRGCLLLLAAHSMMSQGHNSFADAMMRSWSASFKHRR